MFNAHNDVEGQPNAIMKRYLDYQELLEKETENQEAIEFQFLCY